MGFVFVLDALTGEPVYEVEELQVKQSRVKYIPLRSLSGFTIYCKLSTKICSN